MSLAILLSTESAKLKPKKNVADSSNPVFKTTN